MSSRDDYLRKRRRAKRRADRFDMLETAAFWLMVAVGAIGIGYGVLEAVPAARAAYDASPY